ncbi:MAG: hypothetical protein ACE5G0_17190 [Rhodothermales bacterium]
MNEAAHNEIRKEGEEDCEKSQVDPGEGTIRGLFHAVATRKLGASPSKRFNGFDE